MRDVATLKSLVEEQLALPLEQVSVIKLVDLLVEYGYVAKVSDIHLEPAVDELRVRYRIDGLLYDIFGHGSIKRELHPEVISRIKVLSGLRTDEHLLPQDGRFKVKMDDEGGDVDVRVSIVPTYFGENAILRVLAQSKDISIESMGFSQNDLQKIKHAIGKPYGMILANGPTGSGKTTTLYTILKELNKPETSIITIEDPMEYSLLGTTQIQTNAAIGLTFANGLRSILRQDPNIIMVGEIRDEETASIAVNAALTGHLVLSTLHTNDSATTFPRLLDMGVPSFLVASTVNVAIGQRLVRMLCQTCRVERALTDQEGKSLQELIPEFSSQNKLYQPQGCDNCHGSGYLGRIAIREVLEVNDGVRKLIMNRASASEIKAEAIKGGMTTMVEDALGRVSEGMTTIEEVIRVVHE
jgi:type II secretory ATPase GspE/PulE/Tfp pilus assembly ATPase PilB-like protein